MNQMLLAVGRIAGRHAATDGNGVTGVLSQPGSLALGAPDGSSSTVGSTSLQSLKTGCSKPRTGTPSQARATDVSRETSVSVLTGQKRYARDSASVMRLVNGTGGAA
jgi:hypothetical protein